MKLPGTVDLEASGGDVKMFPPLPDGPPPPRSGSNAWGDKVFSGVAEAPNGKGAYVLEDKKGGAQGEDKAPWDDDLGDEMEPNIYAWMAVSDWAHWKKHPVIPFATVCLFCIQLLSPALLIWVGLDGLNLDAPFLFCKQMDNANAVSTRITAILFTTLFYLNSAAAMANFQGEAEAIVRTPHLARSALLLLMGSVANTLCVLGCSIALPFIFWKSPTAKDVVFDSLGILFLYNLDNVDGDLALLSEEAWEEATKEKLEAAKQQRKRAHEGLEKPYRVPLKFLWVTAADGLIL